MLIGSAPRRVAIVGSSRTPFARAHTAYAEANNQQLLVAALRSVVEKYGLQGQRLGDVIAGATIKHSVDFNLVRESLMSAGLHPETPGLDLQRACGTSLEAAVLIANKIALGQIDAGIAGGVECMSDPPVVFPASFRRVLLRAYRARSFGERLRTWMGVRPRHFRPVLPAVVEPRTGLSMGQSCELMVKTWGITRAEQDALALASHRNAAAAWQAGFFDDLVAGDAALARDNNATPRSTSWPRCARCSRATAPAR
jgi:acetyl-CoA C-acetyltransferase